MQSEQSCVKASIFWKAFLFLLCQFYSENIVLALTYTMRGDIKEKSGPWAHLDTTL